MFSNCTSDLSHQSVTGRQVDWMWTFSKRNRFPVSHLWYIWASQRLHVAWGCVRAAVEGWNIHLSPDVIADQLLRRKMAFSQCLPGDPDVTPSGCGLLCTLVCAPTIRAHQPWRKSVDTNYNGLSEAGSETVCGQKPDFSHTDRWVCYKAVAVHSHLSWSLYCLVSVQDLQGKQKWLGIHQLCSVWCCREGNRLNHIMPVLALCAKQITRQEWTKLLVLICNTYKYPAINTPECSKNRNRFVLLRFYNGRNQWFIIQHVLVSHFGSMESIFVPIDAVRSWTQVKPAEPLELKNTQFKTATGDVWVVLGHL